ncbi:MAG: hypothetical protein V7605_1936 [Acidimicrobiaceae bacterium]|jgi:uncharacterized cupredoxin-like copper-binding protein
MMRIRRLLCAGLLPLALLAGCSSSGSSKSATGTGTAADAAKATRTVDVQISADGYTPPTIDVAKGETVTFRVVNNDSTVHEFVLGDAKAQDAYEKTMAAMSTQPMNGMADTPNIIEVKAGQSKDITWAFPNAKTTVIYGSHQPGDYAKGLKGTITVK